MTELSDRLRRDIEKARAEVLPPEVDFYPVDARARVPLFPAKRDYFRQKMTEVLDNRLHTLNDEEQEQRLNYWLDTEVDQTTEWDDAEMEFHADEILNEPSEVDEMNRVMAREEAYDERHGL